jgi:hypothetical protein
VAKPWNPGTGTRQSAYNQPQSSHSITFISQFLTDVATSAGFDGVYVNKAGKTAEGSATFWRCSRFICTAQEDINFRQLFAAILEPPQEAAVLRNSSSKSSSMARVSSRGSSSSSASGQLSSGLSEGAVAAILPLLQASPQLVDSLQRVGTVAQLTLLQPAVRDASSGSSGEISPRCTLVVVWINNLLHSRLAMS